MFEKRHKLGEDSYVAMPFMICVCDGVGGWIRKLVETGNFSREFAVNIQTLYINKQYQNLKDLLDQASKITKSQGSSTCVMAEIKEDDPNTLHTCNLGDSGYWLFRPNHSSKDLTLMFKSEIQQHRFNAPYQTGTDKTWPTKAFSTSHSIQHNDIVVMGSDGIFDNMIEPHFQLCLNSYLDRESLNIIDIKSVADCMSMQAEILGYDPNYNSPFAIEARNHGKKFTGGKADDITVIVAQIKNY